MGLQVARLAWVARGGCGIRYLLKKSNHIV
jgi:hypothetical protein